MTSAKKDVSPAVKVAKEVASTGGQAEVLSTGVRARIVPVGATLVDAATSRIKDPPIPIIHDEAKGRDIENPTDPQYLAAMREADRQRLQAATDTMIMFGVELLEGLPEDDEWVKRLQWQAKHDHLSLEGYDLEDPLDREFLYKKYIAVGTLDLITIGRKAGLRPEDVAEAAASFPSDETRVSD
jgi:hypothetical protein